MIIYNDDNFLIINKPAGILSQKDSADSHDIVWHLKKQKEFSQQSFLAPVHRLDRNTSGLLLLAKNSKSAAILSKEIANKKIKRTYLALVKGKMPDTGKIEYSLSKDEETNTVSVNNEGKNAITYFHCQKHFPTMSLVELELLTGRSHQIRVHLAHIGHEVIGDKKYGKKPWNTLLGRPALHAYKIEMQDPFTRKELIFAAPIPEDISNLLTRISG